MKLKLTPAQRRNINWPALTVSTKGVSYHGEDNTLTCEASDIGLGRTIHEGPIFRDAADIGIFLRSHKTGVVVPFVYVDVEHDNEGDVMAWRFSSYGLDHPIQLVVFND